MIDDIPEAVREAHKKPVPTQISYKSPFPLILGSGLIIGAIAVGGFSWLNRRDISISKQISEEVNAVESNPLDNTESSTESISEPKETIETIETAETTETIETTADNVLGHLSYEEVPESDLVSITSDGRILLRQAAAEKFRQMEADARAQGINLAVISGFRSVEEQNHLFFGVKEQRVQDAAKRAEVSAPPGYSEHHTGYAIDLGDVNVPATHLTTKFENTAAFKWLSENAAKYSFELSFPPDNPQGISYEPWHWRFVGDRDSLETFYKGRNLK